MIRGILAAFMFLLLMAGCQTSPAGQQQLVQVTKIVSATATRTPSRAADTATPLPSATPSATATPSPTFTPAPTATAEPMMLAGNPRLVVEPSTETTSDLICGLVDFFDFPLNPPDARGDVRGGGDFGLYRDRYSKFHAGEDWGISGRRSLGAPVYSVGNGRVTYAEPTGWGRDQGVVIVRHTFADGRQLLAFYGHLDPESFEVRAGDCVTRGQPIAKIGKPKTGPHLHFEMRTHMPLETGTGYWPEDPRLAGWLPPSATIWDSRLAVSPAVLWTKAFTAEGIESVGAAGDDLFLVLDGAELVGIDLATGVELWREALDEDTEGVLLDGKAKVIYTANQFGDVRAFSMPDEEVEDSSPALLPLWQAKIEGTGLPLLMPLPGGGLVLSARGQYAALSAAGQKLWHVDVDARPVDWLIGGEQLIISTTGGTGFIASADASGWHWWDAPATGRLAAGDAHSWLYDGRAIYRLDPRTRSAEKTLDLSPSSMQMGDILAAADGNLLLFHADPFDRRLIMLDEQGSILWERSIAGLGEGTVKLSADQGRLYLLLRETISSGSEVSLLAVDGHGAQLTYLFHGGTRNDAVDQTALYGVGGGRILVNIDGRRLTVIDGQEAEVVVSSHSNNSH